MLTSSRLPASSKTFRLVIDKEEADWLVPDFPSIAEIHPTNHLSRNTDPTDF